MIYQATTIFFFGLLLATILPRLTFALHVTPGSPCAEFCLDENLLDQPNANSSSSSSSSSTTTTGDDIVCNDFEFSSDQAGKTFQRCMTCLQGSEYVNGTESDLDWFLYNLRYAFDYCIFGDMRAADVDSSPCTTSEGCGRLTNALREDMVNSTGRSPYGYCDADQHAMQGEGFDKCLSCVSAEATHSYISNFLVALAIGCDQQPAPGTLLGVNETVFTKNTVQAINPSQLDSSSDHSSTHLLPTTAIVGISVGGLVLLLLALGCGYMQYRKRKNRQRASGWSFRCQSAPSSGSFPPRDVAVEEAKTARFHELMGERMRTSPVESRVTGLFPAPPASTMSDSKPSARDGVTSIVTKFPPRPALQTSGRNFTSPIMDDHMTPSSAISVRSTKPLLRNDSPASHSVRSFSSHHGQADTMCRNGGSPLTAQSATPGWTEHQRMVPAPRTLTGSPNMTRQTEVRNFSTAFPPPPKR